MKNLLIVSDMALDLSFINEKYDSINIRQTGDDDILMEVFQEDAKRTAHLREKIEAYQPKRILVVGEMGNYVWLGTLLTSLFGKFNAWLGQYEQEYASTELKVDGKKVPLLAIKSIEDFHIYEAWRDGSLE